MQQESAMTNLNQKLTSIQSSDQPDNLNILDMQQRNLYHRSKSISQSDKKLPTMEQQQHTQRIGR